MSKPPERSWMLATLIGSSAQALGPNMPAAAAAAVPCKNLLRLIFIAGLLLVVVADETRYFFKTDGPHPAAVGASLVQHGDRASAGEMYLPSPIQLAIWRPALSSSQNITPI